MDHDFEQAVVRADVERVRECLDHGTDINSLDGHSQTALMLAAHRGHVAVVRLLVARGADLDRTAKYGLSALMLAAISGHADAAKTLVEAGARLDIRGTGAPGFDGKTALDLARAGGWKEIVTLIERKAPAFSNVYDDASRAAAYAELEFPGTYYLAYRDLPEIISNHVEGRRALDFGCGTGRSTRFLRELGFDTVGIDIAEQMLTRARELDPYGDYRLVPDGELGDLAANSYDLVLCAFTFDNIPTTDQKVSLFRGLHRALKPHGRIVNLVSAPEIYVNEWASFSTKDFPDNRVARSGDRVRIVMLDVPDRRPVEDILWTDEAYQAVYAAADLVAIDTHRPLATPDEPFAWVGETEIAPWVIYVLGPTVPSKDPLQDT